VTDDERGQAAARHRKCMMLFGQLGITRQERLEFAATLLWRDVETFRDLSDFEIARLLDALEGFAFISHILSTRVHPYSQTT
jgi:hypothetical protein